MYDVTSCMAAWSHVPSRGYLSLVPCSLQGVSAWGSLSREVHVHLGSLEGDRLPLPPMESEKWTVHILLECFLVSDMDYCQEMEDIHISPVHLVVSQRFLGFLHPLCSYSLRTW